MRLLKHHLENAFESLRAHRLRTGLTLVGIMLGIASLTITISLLGGVHTLFAPPTATTGGTIALVRSGLQPSDNLLTADLSGLGTAHTLTERDSTALGRLPGVTAAPMSVLRATLTANRDKTTVKADQATIIGTTAAFKQLANLEVAAGQFIDEVGGAVIGEQLSIDLFGTENSVGNVFSVGGEPITVVGVLKKTAATPSYIGGDLSMSAIIPLSTAKQFTQRTAQIQQIVLSASDATTLSAVLSTTRDTLDKLHQGAGDYHIVTEQQLLAARSRLTTTVATTVAVIAGVSLLMGGIGIMSIMLVNVAERQREVAIRKAIGATNGQIIRQFLIEAGLISLIGGGLGYLLGLGGLYALSWYLPLTITLEWQLALLAVSTALLTGLLFGLYPALRATNRNLIDSLRI